MTWRDFMDPEPLTVDSLREKDLAYLNRELPKLWTLRSKNPLWGHTFVELLPLALRRAALGDSEPLADMFSRVLGSKDEYLCVRDAIISEATNGVDYLTPHPNLPTLKVRGQEVCKAQEFHLLLYTWLYPEFAHFVDPRLLEALEGWAKAAEDAALDTSGVCRIERWLELCPIPEEMQLTCVHAPLEGWVREMMDPTYSRHKPLTKN